MLWDIDMEIVRGSAVAFIRRNSVGKTTFFKDIMRVQKLAGGKITLGG